MAATNETARWLGIDFSGNHLMWRAGARRSNVWIATLEAGDADPRVGDLRRVQDLPGDAPPFDRLVCRLRRADYRAACLDAPICVPRACLPPGGHGALASAVARVTPPGRPFATGAALVEQVMPHAAPRGAKRYRVCEDRWREAGLNVRSATWNGPRGGAPLAAAALTLIARTQRPVWPWKDHGAEAGLIAEGYPAAQLVTWGLPATRYGGDDTQSRARRALIVGALQARGVVLGSWSAVMAASADALDAVLAALCAWALDLDRLVERLPTALDEGWIAVGR